MHRCRAPSVIYKETPRWLFFILSRGRLRPVVTHGKSRHWRVKYQKYENLKREVTFFVYQTEDLRESKTLPTTNNYPWSEDGRWPVPSLCALRHVLHDLASHIH